jgi:hypothetical protein
MRVKKAQQRSLSSSTNNNRRGKTFDEIKPSLGHGVNNSLQHIQQHQQLDV